MTGDPRKTRQWLKLKAQVVREEPVCWLRLPGCTIASQTADHVLTVKERPDLGLVRANLRGACHHCNNARNDRPPPAPRPQPAALAWFD